MPKDDWVLPNEVNAFIDGLIKRAGSLRVQREVRREIMAHFEDALEGLSEEEIPRRAAQLVSEFGDPKVLCVLIRRGKRRCRSPFERFVVASLKVMLAALVLAVAAALVQGHIAERDFRTSLTTLEKDGLISDPSQLRSTRPAGAVYFAGPAEESAAAFLLSLNDQPEALFDEVASAFKKLEDTDGALTCDYERIRESLVPLRPLIEKARSAASLPATPMDQVVKLAHFQGSASEAISPSIQPMNLVRCFLLEACVRYGDGQLDEALRSLETALQLSEHLRDFPLLIPQMIGMSVQSNSFRLLGRMGGLGKFSDTAMAQLLPYTTRAEAERAALAQALTAESLNGRKVFHADAEFLVASFRTVGQPFSVRAKNWFLAHLYFTPMFRFMSAPDKLGYFTRYHEVAQSLKGPYFSMHEQRRLILPSKELPRTQTLTRLIAPLFTRDFGKNQAVCEAHAALVRTAIDLERYKRVNGQYPPALTALAPPTRPDYYVDPFTGQLLTYVLSGDAFLLYSFGWDGEDGRLRKDSAGVADSDDIVWGK